MPAFTLPKETVQSILPSFPWRSLRVAKCIIWHEVLWTLPARARSVLVQGNVEDLVAVLPEHLWREKFRELGITYDPPTPVERAQQREIRAVQELRGRLARQEMA